MKISVDKVGRGSLALILGTFAGYVFYSANLPLPWMLGAMIANAAAALFGAPVASPMAIRPAMMGVLGTMLGASFGPEFLAHVLLWKTTLAGMLGCSLVGAAGSYVVLRRLGGMSRPTAYFAAMPGGLAEMVTLAEQGEADVRMVSLVHAFRIFLTVLCLPFVIGMIIETPIVRGAALGHVFELPSVDTLAWLVGVTLIGCLLGHFLRLPAKFLLGPLILSAIVHVSGLSDFMVAPILVAGAQIVIGTNIGTRFAGFDKRLILRTAGVSTITTAILLGVAGLFSYLVSQLADTSSVVLLLAYAPGGLAEMSLIALALHIEIAFVATHHLLRVVSVIVFARLFSPHFSQPG